MNKRLIFVFLSIIIVSGFLHSQTVEEHPGSQCDYSPKERDKVEEWLNKSFKEAKDAIKSGRKYNGQHHQLPPCKIKEIEDLYQKLKFEYDCTCGVCGVGGTSHNILKGTPFIRICDPLSMYWKRRNVDLNKPPTTLCGCVQGLIVHELVHASGDPTEEGAVDCSKILYPCETDPYGDETPDHSNCCCVKEGN